MPFLIRIFVADVKDFQGSNPDRGVGSLSYYKNQKKKGEDIIGVSFLAQCLISLVLGKPDFARARPSTLLTDESTYENLYEKNQDLETFYKAASIGRAIKNNLKHTVDMTPAERSDVLFYLIYAVVAKRLEKSQISFEDIKKFDLETLSDEEIDSVKSVVYAQYKTLGGNGRVAKSATFIEAVKSAIGLENNN